MGYLHHRPVGTVPRPPFEGFEPRTAAQKRVALLLERVGVVVVPVALPEAGMVLRRQLDPAQPLRALPEVLPGHDQPQRPAVLAAQRLAVGVRREHRALALEELDRDVGREACLGVRDREARRRARAGELAERRPGDALEGRVEPAPARDAVDVLRHLDPRQLAQLLPAQRQRRVDLAGDREVPAGEIGRILGDRRRRGAPAISRSGTGRAAAARGRSPPRRIFFSALPLNMFLH